MQTKDDPRFLKVSEVALRLRCGAATIRREIDRGNLPAVRVGTAVRIDRDDLDEYLHRDREPA